MCMAELAAMRGGAKPIHTKIGEADADVRILRMEIETAKAALAEAEARLAELRKEAGR